MTDGMPVELVVEIVGGVATVVGAVLVLDGVLLKTLLGGKTLGLTATQRLVDELQEERVALLARMDAMDARMRGWETDRQRDHRLIAGLRRAYVELRRHVRAAGVPLPPIPQGLGVEDSHPSGLPVVVATTVTAAGEPAVDPEDLGPEDLADAEDLERGTAA